MQLNLLRVLQEKEVRPVGGVTNIKGDVRVVAATNVDLEQAMLDGRFRRDLYYRLAVVTVDLPPLRERRCDIAALAYHFMRKYAAIYDRELSDITPEAMSVIMENPWPGNVRELENVMERAVLLSAGPLIDETSLPLPVRQMMSHKTKRLEPFKNVIKTAGRNAEKKAILKALKETGGNKTMTARILGISRSSLYNKICELGIGKS